MGRGSVGGEQEVDEGAFPVPEPIEPSGFRGDQGPLISCHVSIRVCFDICL